MPDLAPARAAEGLRLARSVSGHVILMHIALGSLVVQALQLLLFADHAERAGRENLRLPSREDARSVHARQNAVFAPDLADIREASSVRADSLVENLRADLFLGEIIERVLHLPFFSGIDLGKVLQRLLFHRVLPFLTGRAVAGIERAVQLFGSERADGFIDFRGDVIELHLPLLFADRLYDLLLESALLFDLLMPEQDGAHHVVVRNLLGASLDHHDRVLGAGEIQRERALFFLRERGVDDVFAVHDSHDHAAGRPRKGNVRNGQRDGRAQHRQRFGRDIRIDGERGGDHADVVEQSLREQRAERAVDEARGQNALVARSALPSLKAAGDLAHRIHLLLEVYAQGEIIHSVARLFRHHDVDHDHGLSAANDAGPVGLFRVFARLHRDLPSADGGFKLSVRVCHNSFS